MSEELNIRRIAAKFVSRLLQNEQKHPLEVCKEIKQQLLEDPDFLSKVDTGSIRFIFLPPDENQV
jgi:hypothetical protein